LLNLAEVAFGFAFGLQLRTVRDFAYDLFDRSLHFMKIAFDFILHTWLHLFSPFREIWHFLGTLFGVPFLHQRKYSSLQFQQSVEEGTIALQSKAQIFSGHVIAAVPLLFQARALVGKSFSESLHHRSNELIGVFDRPARLVDETSLNPSPLRSKLLHLRFRKQRHGHRNLYRSIYGF